MPGPARPALEGFEHVAELISSGSAKRIVFLTGAGVSVGAGIPDFRSPGGMYDTLRPQLLTAERDDQEMMASDPTWVVNRSLFERNQFPYMEVRRPFIIGTAESKWKATLTHFFMRICHDRGLLHRVYTQNIDGLDFQTGVPMAKIVPVHGTMGRVQCEFCAEPFEGDIAAFAATVKTHIKDIYKTDADAPSESRNIVCGKCKRPGVKPATVMYGGAMPSDFFQATNDDFEAPADDDAKPDLLVVIGTALTVFPAASVPNMVSETCPRVLINRERVGGIGKRAKDVFLGGDADATVLQLARALGWLSLLAEHKAAMAPQSAALLEQAMADMAATDDSL